MRKTRSLKGLNTFFFYWEADSSSSVPHLLQLHVLEHLLQIVKVCWLRIFSPCCSSSVPQGLLWVDSEIYRMYIISLRKYAYVIIDVPGRYQILKSLNIISYRGSNMFQYHVFVLEGILFGSKSQFCLLIIVCSIV